MTIVATIEEHGWVYLPDRSQADLVDVLETLGAPIHVEEIIVQPDAKPLVKSRDGISWHTDHARADRIVWYCLGQTDRGGETMVVDARQGFALLSPEHQQALERVTLQEHSVFTGDQMRSPLVRHTPSGPRFYYSLWLADDDMAGIEREAFEAFGAALRHCQHHTFRLQRGDILAIDNGRMLHARTPIVGSATRHLRRYWLTAC